MLYCVINCILVQLCYSYFITFDFSISTYIYRLTLRCCYVFLLLAMKR